MDVDRHREMRKCYNCGEMGHLTARYSKPRRERSEKVRIVEEAKEDFSLGRECQGRAEQERSHPRMKEI